MTALALIEAGELLHPALEDPAASVPLAAARWNDRWKLAALLQASALLAHLEHAGWHLVAGFRGVRARADGGLLATGAAPGRSPRPAQELLRDLLGELFGSAVAVSGRGEARRAARSLLDAWRQSLTPLPADEAVRQVLEVAPFLWEPAFAPARRALAAEYRNGGGGRPHLWVAGPGPFRDRLLARGQSRGEAMALLASPAARGLWEEEGRAAVTPGERLAAAAALYARGRFIRALAALSGLRSPAAAILRLRCRFPLGESGAVRDGLRQLAASPLSPEEILDAAEVAVRAFANSNEPERAREWAERALAAGALTARAHLLAAEAAWDRGAAAALASYLEAARPALADPALAWRWHQVKGLEALSAGDGETLLQSLARALAGSRRQLSRHLAAGLWNDLGIGRVGVGDLAGAERAFRHSVRLFGGCDGPRRTTLALYNLAEIRLRRGAAAGVREILEQSTTENRLAGNLRGLTQDSEMWARLELLLGRPGAALTLCREALRQLDAARSDWRRAFLHVLAARALGWLGRAEEAAAELAETTAAARAELEPEERPALRAQAGDREGALAEAAGTPFAPLWRAALTGETLEAAEWDALDGLEPYRAARLVFDLESVSLTPGGTVPAERRRAAVATLRRTGSGLLAERLEVGDGGPWQALFAFLLLGRLEAMPASPATGEAADPTEAPDPPVRTAAPTGGVVGESPALKAALERLSRLAPRDLTVLVLGETGTGKELAARLVHRGSPRARGPFVAVNCAALGESLLLSDLFGHVRGAFTGADRDRAGVFETAQRGTVFLDEIGDLPMVAQGMLLRVLQEGEVRRVGESLPRRVDVRVVAATHRDLAAAVAAGGFREDLFYRLKVGSVLLPPLRERGADVLLLAEHFLARERGPGFVPRLSRPARERLLAHRFPGNVRELENILSVAAALAGGGTIEPEHLGLPEPAAKTGAPAHYHRQVEEFRRQKVIEALAATAGNQAEAARLLGLSRQALSYLVRQFKLL